MGIDEPPWGGEPNPRGGAARPGPPQHNTPMQTVVPPAAPAAASSTPSVWRPPTLSGRFWPVFACLVNVLVPLWLLDWWQLSLWRRDHDPGPLRRLEQMARQLASSQVPRY